MSQLLDGTAASQFDRLPPHSIEAEMCLIASMMLDKEMVGTAVGIVGSTDNPQNQGFFGVVVAAAACAFVAQLRPDGMARAMLATAGVHVIEARITHLATDELTQGALQLLSHAAAAGIGLRRHATGSG